MSEWKDNGDKNASTILSCKKFLLDKNISKDIEDIMWPRGDTKFMFEY